MHTFHTVHKLKVSITTLVIPSSCWRGDQECVSTLTWQPNPSFLFVMCLSANSDVLTHGCDNVSVSDVKCVCVMSTHRPQFLDPRLVRLSVRFSQDFTSALDVLFCCESVKLSFKRFHALICSVWRPPVLSRCCHVTFWGSQNVCCRVEKGRIVNLDVFWGNFPLEHRAGCVTASV